MAVTLQASAVSIAQSMIKIAPLLLAARSAVVEQNALYSDITPNTVWQHLPTFVWANDGSVGSPDGSPNTAHPISTSGINRSSTELVALAGVFADFETFMNGGALEAGSSRLAVIDQIVG